MRALLGVLLLLIVWPCSAHANDARSLVPDIATLEDATGGLTIDQLAAPTNQARFRPATTDRPNFGYTESVHWFRLRYTLPPGGEPWLLQVDFPQLDHLTVFVPNPQGGWTHYRTGDRLPVHTRPRHHPAFVFDVPHHGGEQTLYIRAQTEGVMLLPVKLWRVDAFAEEARDLGLARGLYYAFLASLALYNLFLFVAARERGYLFYVGYLGPLVMSQAAFHGDAALYLWPNSPTWGSTIGVASLAFGVASGLLFIREMTAIHRFSRRLHQLMNGLAAANLVAVPLLFVSYGVGVRIATVLLVCSVIAVAAPVGLAAWRGYSPARYVALAYASVAPGAVLLGLRSFDLVPSNALTEWAIHVGTAVEALLLSFALADRIRTLREGESRANTARLAAEKETLKAQQALSSGLILAQDAERKRIASELHDGVGQNALVLLNELRRHAKNAPELDALGDVAADTVDALRGVARRLHPHQLDRLGLAEAVRTAAASMTAGADIALTTDIEALENRLPRDIELHVYRVAQEALSNVVHHARASRVVVTLGVASNEHDGEQLVLTIEDNGEGMAAGAVDGLGIASMRERARSSGGTITLQECGGVTLTLRVPITDPS